MWAFEHKHPEHTPYSDEPDHARILPQERLGGNPFDLAQVQLSRAEQR